VSIPISFGVSAAIGVAIGAYRGASAYLGQTNALTEQFDKFNTLSMFLTKEQSVLLAQPLWLERNLFSQPQNPLIGVQPGKRPVCSGKRLVSDWAMPHLTCSQLFLEGRFPKLAKLCGTSIVACRSRG
jgi:hypothetical protein